MTAGPAITTLRAMAGVRTKRLRWSMFWAVVSYIVTILGTQLTNYLTSFDLSPLQGALVSTGVGLGVVMIGVMIDHAREPGPEPAGGVAGGTRYPYQGYPPQGYPTQPVRPARSNGRTSLAAALAIILLMCGAGGLGVTYFAQWLASRAVASFDEITGESKANPGVERLAAPASKTSGVLTVTVKSVQVNDKATIVDLAASNAGRESLTLTRGFCQLMVPGKTTLETDKFVGTWGTGEVAAGGERNGTIIFDGRLEPDTKKVTLAFTTIFGTGFGGPRDISVDITLN
jgi:hypothetical protein